MPRPTPRVAGAVVGALALWLVGLAWFRPWIAHDDFAIFRIALERELDGHLRVVGAHSRLGVFHPGPLREWVFAGPYWLSGRRASALPATALVLNAGWAVWALVVARRLRPAIWGAACAVGLLVAVAALGADLGSPWNPHLAILPMYVACWSLVTVISRHGDGWVGCVCSASFAAQMHASVLGVAAVVLGAALVALVWQRERRRAVAAIGLAVLLWSGPIVDLRKGADANLIRLRTVGADGVGVGLGDALGHVSRLLWPGTPLSRVSVRPSAVEFIGFFRWWLLLVVVALAAAAVFARNERGSLAAADDRRNGSAQESSVVFVATVVAIGVVALSVVSVSLFVEPAYRYLYGPLQGASVFVIAVLLGSAVLAAERLAGRSVPHVDWVRLAIVPALSVAVVLAVPREDGDAAARRALDVEDTVTAALAERPDWVQVEALPLDLRDAGDLDAEVLDVVVRRGVDARSRRPELGLPAPDGADGVFAVTMSPSRDCLLTDPGVDEIIRGMSTAGETFSVVTVDVGSTAYDRCIGPPAG